MAAHLRDVALEFARGEATLGALRAAAYAELIDRTLANGLLGLITQWENSPGKDSVRVRNDLREGVKRLVPAAPAKPAASTYRRDPSESLYAAGLRGQQRRG